MLTLTGEVGKHIELGKLIAQRAAQHQRPAVLELIESGRTVPLGPISADRSGLAYGGQLIPWQFILSLSFGFSATPQGPEKQLSNLIDLRINDVTVCDLSEISELPVAGVVDPALST